MTTIQASKKVKVKKKSIPFFKIEEIDNNQNIYWEIW